MRNFIQAHVLTFYPPSNPNRDEGGRPKTCVVGGTERLRLSSQSLKRAVRMSEAFQTDLRGHLGHRTQRIGETLHARLVERGFSTKEATAQVRPVIALFGKPRDESGETPLLTEQLAFLSQGEVEAAMAMVEAIEPGDKPLSPKPGDVLKRVDASVDVALFGRMFADAPGYNRDGAVQMGHAFSCNAVEVDSDFYTAVDDLKRGVDDDKGAGFIGDVAFGSAIHYLYACVDTRLLVRNLGTGAEVEALATAGVKALLRGLATTSPSGKRTSFAHNPLAAFVMTEAGDVQPRSLASAYLDAVRGGDIMAKSVEALARSCRTMDRAYGPRAAVRCVLDATVAASEGTTADRDFGSAETRPCDSLDELLEATVA